MSTVAEAAAALRDALTTVEGVRPYTDIGGNLDPPAAIVGPPVLGWGAFAGQVTSARFTVWIVVKADEMAQERLWQLVPAVAEAIEAEIPDAAVQAGPTAAVPATFPTSSSELPGYQLTVEIVL